MIQTKYSKVAQTSATNNMHEWNSDNEEELDPIKEILAAPDEATDSRLGEDAEGGMDGLPPKKISLEDEGEV
mgnify:FL=1